MHGLKYLAGYSEKVTSRVSELIAADELRGGLLAKYPAVHEIQTDKALYDFTVEIKNEYLRKSQPLSKVAADESGNTRHQYSLCHRGNVTARRNGTQTAERSAGLPQARQRTRERQALKVMVYSFL